ncbi:MAG: hypothetical protein PUF04_09610 [bacterium]|nr:hypothetical protein [bacterium]
MSELLKVGDRVSHPEYGYGVIRQVDQDDSSFPYYVEFEYGGDAWPFFAHITKLPNAVTFRKDAESLLEDVL